MNMYRAVAITLLSIPLLLMGWKLGNGYLTFEKLVPKTEYEVQINCTIDRILSPQELFVKLYIPESDRHQRIKQASAKTGELGFRIFSIDEVGKRGVWRGEATGNQELSYSFKFRGKALRYNIDDDLPITPRLPERLAPYLAATEHIQADDNTIIRQASQIVAGKEDLKSVVTALYDYVHLISSIKTSKLTDAVTTLKERRASCNGKSRLLVAFCRALGIPARVVGGIILENTKKRKSHLWVEIWMGKEWVPFDALNGHFAYLPAHYLKMYQGDHFLITRTPGIAFDYSFVIQQEKFYAAKHDKSLTLWALLSNGNISLSLLKVILLLPLCAVVVGIFKNVVGIKTIGVFLPAIIAVSLDGVGPVFGLSAFAIVVGVVALLHFPLERWGILHTPKLIIMLTAVVVCLLGFTWLGITANSQLLSAMVFFPIIVLTIAAEKFARTIVDSGFGEAMKLQAQTLVLTMICYFVFKPDFMVGYLLTFPETYAFLVGILLLLGRWIGIRLTEYSRFGAIAK